MWSGVFLPRILPATGGGDDIDIELPQGVRKLRVTAYNATAVRGPIAVYLRIGNVNHLIGASTPGVVLEPLQVTHDAIVARNAQVRVTFSNTIAADALHANLSYELPEASS
jgi:hypothetical protein